MNVELQQFHTPRGWPNLSPFCMKVETWLRLAGVDYRVVTQPLPNGPMGKLPVAIIDGEKIADSHSIIARLSAVSGVDLDAGLDARQRAAARAFERLINEHLYWALVYFRWIDDAGWAQMQSVVLGRMPLPLRLVVAPVARRGVRAQLKGHGLGRHPPQEILRRAAQDLQALADWLGDQPYFMGDDATSLDASAYAFIANLYDAPVETPLKALVAAHPNLVAYCARLQQRCFGRDPRPPATSPT
ncbi:glutathione S-transferase family protein [Solimonas marina]|uniref:Glutathione S-transferase family protein n=1 Tax=Solimonas marina TaxID=2714601 RepID=A0A969W789_9GAMM|nr:glutathione S-transferase family protein [Solimonas marina]NKF21238.1 glutathione S-transferase family protein [Solimonas marina]